MDPLSISAASGMRARMESLDMLANNLANATTVGYKSDREFYSLYASAEAATGSMERSLKPSRFKWTTGLLYASTAPPAVRARSLPPSMGKEGKGKPYRVVFSFQHLSFLFHEEEEVALLPANRFSD